MIPGNVGDGESNGFSVTSGSTVFSGSIVSCGVCVFPGSVGDGENIGIDTSISSPPPSEVTVPA